MWLLLIVLALVRAETVSYCLNSPEIFNVTRYGDHFIAEAYVLSYGGEVCNADSGAACATTSQVCDNGECVCYSCDPQCPAGEICQNSKCRSLPPKFLEDYTVCSLKCGPREVCVNGRCSPIKFLRYNCQGDYCDVPQNAELCALTNALPYEDRPTCGETEVGVCEFGRIGCVDGEAVCENAIVPEPETETSCSIGSDKDCDGLVGCDDPDCASFPACSCVPDCTGKVCGSDGCGGSCGTVPPTTACTIYSCSSGQIVTSEVFCDDGLECTVNSCDPITGCSFTNELDGTLCSNGAGQCTGGVCEIVCTPDCAGKNCGSDGCGGSCGTVPPSTACDSYQCSPSGQIITSSETCDDGLECTADSCNPNSGCTFVNKADGTSCNNGEGQCSAGVCEIICENGVQDGDETGVDCGGSCPTACPTCSDGVQNGDETDVDCGGSCPACPTCSDGVQNGDETGVDCGGSCPACVLPVCGNGIVETGEGCDLGDDNGIRGIGCTSDCLVEGECMSTAIRGLSIFRQLGVYQFTHPFNALENPTLTACGGAGGGSSGNPLIQEFGRPGRNGDCASATFNSVVKGQTYFFSIASGGVPGGPLCSGSEAGGAGQSQSLNFPGFNLIGGGGLGGSGTDIAPGDATTKTFNIAGIDNSAGGSGGQLIQNGICPASGTANGGDGEPAAGGGGGGLVNTAEGGDCGNGFCAGSGGFGGNGVVIRNPFKICSQYAACGNGILERGESCDDGNLIDGDGCPSTCVTEVIVTPELINQWTDSGPEGESATSLARLSTADLAIDLDIPTVGFLNTDQAVQFAYFFGSAISNYMIADPSIFVNPLISKFNAPTVLVNRNNPAISYTCTVTSGPAWENFVGALVFRSTLGAGCLNQYILLNDQAGVTTLEALANLEFHVSMGVGRPCNTGSFAVLGAVNGRCAPLNNPCNLVGCGPFERCNEDNGQCYLWIDDETCGSPTNNCTDQNLLCSRISLENSQPYKCVECREDAQCPYPGAVCSLGGNDPGCKNPPNGPCTATADCIDGLICESNECKVPAENTL